VRKQLGKSNTKNIPEMKVGGPKDDYRGAMRQKDMPVSKPEKREIQAAIQSFQ